MLFKCLKMVNILLLIYISYLILNSYPFELNCYYFIDLRDVFAFRNLKFYQ